MAPTADANSWRLVHLSTQGPAALLAVAAGLITLAGATYALFGPLVSADGRTISHYEDGLEPLALLVFAGWAAGGVALVVAGASALAGRRAAAIPLTIIVSATLVNVLAWLTALSLGYLVLPGAVLAAVAGVFAYRRYA